MNHQQQTAENLGIRPFSYSEDDELVYINLYRKRVRFQGSSCQYCWYPRHPEWVVVFRGQAEEEFGRRACLSCCPDQSPALKPMFEQRSRPELGR